MLRAEQTTLTNPEGASGQAKDSTRYLLVSLVIVLPVHSKVLEQLIGQTAWDLESSLLAYTPSVHLVSVVTTRLLSTLLHVGL